MAEISVIIPVYNSEKYVEKCIRSVMEQTFFDVEILVINDGSQDRSRELLEELAEEDSRIRLFHQENSGVGAARNKGLSLATGRYLTFLDGDDYLAPDYLEAFYTCAEKEDRDMVICGLTYVDPEGKVLDRLVPGPYLPFEKEEWTFRISAVCSHFYRRELWEKHGIRFQTGERGEDMPVSLFFAGVCDKIATISGTGYYYVQHDASAAHNFRGLKNYRLPYKGLEESIQKARAAGLANSEEYFELFVLRILATCLFQLAPGASRENMRELTDYIRRILHTYFPDYYKNQKAHLIGGAQVPFAQKAAVRILVLLVRTGLLRPFSMLISRKH